MFWKKKNELVVEGLIELVNQRSEYVKDSREFGFSSIVEMQACIDDIASCVREMVYEVKWLPNGSYNIERVLQLGIFKVLFKRFTNEKEHLTNIKLYLGDLKLVNELDSRRPLQKLQRILNSLKVFDINSDLPEDLLSVLDGLLVQVKLLNYRYASDRRIEDEKIVFTYRFSGKSDETSYRLNEMYNLKFSFDLENRELENIELQKFDGYAGLYRTMLSGRGKNVIIELANYLVEQEK